MRTLRFVGAVRDPCLRFNDGAAFEAMMGRWSVLVAEPFLDWLALPQGLDWLDDGCLG